MPTSGHRQERIADQIRTEIAEMISRDLKDPRIGFTTVTRVDVSHDLSHARVLVSVLGTPEEQQNTLAGLASASGFLRHELGRRMRVRRTPELSFVLDQSVEESLKLETLLQKLKERQ